MTAMHQSDTERLLERLYFHELDRKQQIEANIALPTGAIVAAFGVLGYLFTHFRFGGAIYALSYGLEILFMASSIFTVGILALATYWCIQTAIGSSYQYLPGPQTIRDYSLDLINWHNVAGTRAPEVSTQKEMQQFLFAAFARCGQNNFQTNNVRSEELFRTKRAAAMALATLAVSATCYYIDFWFDPQKMAT